MDKATSEIRVHKLGIDPVVRKDHEECLGGYVFEWFFRQFPPVPKTQR